MENNFKQEEETEFERTSTNKNKVGGLLSSIFSGNFLKQERVIKSLPFLFFLVFLGILYIGNGFIFESQVRKIAKTKKEVKDMRAKYITIQSKLNFKSRQSQVASSVASLGLKIPNKPPYRIVVNQKTYDSLYTDNER